MSEIGRHIDETITRVVDVLPPLLDCNPYSITLMAREHPEKLGFAVSVIGKRTLISRRSLLRFLTGEGPEESGGHA